MKRSLLVLACTLLIVCSYSQKIIQQAIINVKTEITFPQNGSLNAPPPPAGAAERQMVFIGGGPGGTNESETKVYYKGNMLKIVNNGFGNNMVIIDGAQKRTTTLMEIMGQKTGFYTTEEDMAEMRNREDSMRNAQQGGGSLLIQRQASSEVQVEYTDSTKTIAGLACRKALLHSKNSQGEWNSTEVWYCPDFKMDTSFEFNRVARMGGINGLEKINGFPMQYSIIRSNGLKIGYEVTNADLNAVIDDKEFEIPKGYTIKSQKEMMQGAGSNMRFFFRNND